MKTAPKQSTNTYDAQTGHQVKEQASVYKCNLCLTPIFTNLNVVATDMGHLLLKNK